jgi:hypothetical protein
MLITTQMLYWELSLLCNLFTEGTGLQVQKVLQYLIEKNMQESVCPQEGRLLNPCNKMHICS